MIWLFTLACQETAEDSSVAEEHEDPAQDAPPDCHSW